MEIYSVGMTNLIVKIAFPCFNINQINNNKIMATVKYFEITPNSTDETYQSVFIEDVDDGDVLGGCDSHYYEIGEDELPSEIDDIRGLIHNEPPRVFGYVDDQGITRYFGLSYDLGE